MKKAEVDMTRHRKMNCVSVAGHSVLCNNDVGGSQSFLNSFGQWVQPKSPSSLTWRDSMLLHFDLILGCPKLTKLTLRDRRATGSINSIQTNKR
jgi:hypothetical protein